MMKTINNSQILQKITVILTPIVMAAVMAFVLPIMSVQVYAENNIYYLDTNGKMAGPVQCKPITEITSILERQGGTDGWYMAAGETTITSSSFTIKGEVNLILCDEANLQIPLTIQMERGSSLTIWAQSTDEKKGRLNVHVKDQNMAIQGQNMTPQDESCSLTIKGGSVNATSDMKQAIWLPNGDITVNGGTVTAEGSTGILSGSLTVTGGHCGAVSKTQTAIELMSNFKDASLSVSGGSLSAKGQDYGIRVNSLSLSGKTKAVFSGGTTEASGEDNAAMNLQWGDAASVDDMEVYSSKETGALPVQASKRNEALSNSKYLKITPCKHGEMSYTDNKDGQHSINCKYCDKSYGTEKHNYTNHVCLCGLMQPTHKITFYANNGTDEQTGQTVYDGEETVLTENSFSWEDHVFAGWNTVQNPSDTDPGTSYTDGDKVTLSGNLILYGQWTLTPVNTPKITAQSGDLSLTYGYEDKNELSVTASADDGNTLKYQWFTYTKENKSDLQEVSGAVSDKYVIPEGMDSGTYYYYCEVKAVNPKGRESKPVVSNTAKVKIEQREVTVSAKDTDEVTYDAKEHSGSAVITFTGIQHEHNAVVTYLPAKGKNVNTYTGEFLDDFRVIGSGNKDVTGNYILTKKQPGTLTIKPAGLTIKVIDQTYEYNGRDQGENNMSYVDSSKIAGKITAGELQDGDTITSVTLNGFETKIGEYPGKIEITHFTVNNDATAKGNYDVTLVPGKLSIKHTKHDLTKTDEVRATCTADGTKAYWTCGICKKMFSDEKGENEIAGPEIIKASGHYWGEWEVTKKPAAGKDGEKRRICRNDPSHIEEAAIPYEEKTVPDAQVSGTLLSKLTTVGSKSLKLTWRRIDGADGYDIFFSLCGRHSLKKVKTISGNKTIRWMKKGLKKNTAYKACVKAWVMKNGKKTYVKSGMQVHTYTSGGTKNYTNPKSVTVKEAKVALRTGKKYKIKAKVNKLHKGKKLMSTKHAPKLRYISSNKKIATVSKSGKIMAKAQGSCSIYVIAVNGVKRNIKLTVK